MDKDKLYVEIREEFFEKFGNYLRCYEIFEMPENANIEDYKGIESFWGDGTEFKAVAKTFNNRYFAPFGFDMVRFIVDKIEEKTKV